MSFADRDGSFDVASGAATRAGMLSPHSTPRLESLLVIADDLTGACDAAVAFAGFGKTVQVALTDREISSSGICAISTDSRDLPVEQAEQRLAKLASRLPLSQNVFKKIDSVFRGNTFAEIAAALKHFPADLAVIAPAYPALGRLTIGGCLYLHKGAGHRSVAIRDDLAPAGCVPHVVPSGLTVRGVQERIRALLGSEHPVVLRDARGQADLNTIVQAVRALAVRTLWIGCGGLAHALAAEHGERVLHPDHFQRHGRAVFFIGSQHPVTRGQVLHLRRVHSVHSVGTANPLPAGAGPALICVERDASSIEHLRNITKQLSPEELGCLFFTGGDTASMVCRALEISALELHGEFAPGVPQGVARGGRFDGVPILSKSGGFGERNLLARVVAAFSVASERLSPPECSPAEEELPA